MHGLCVSMSDHAKVYVPDCIDAWLFVSICVRYKLAAVSLPCLQNILEVGSVTLTLTLRSHGPNMH